MTNLLRAPLPVAVRLLFSASPGLTVTLFALVLMGGALPVGMMLGIGAVVARVVAAAGQGPRTDAAGALLASVGVVLGLYVANQLFQVAREAVTLVLRERYAVFVQQRTLAALSRPLGVAHLEDTRVQGEVGRIRGWQDRLSLPSDQFVDSLGPLLSAKLQGFGAAVVLSRFRWWAPFVLVVGWWLTQRWLRAEMGVGGFKSEPAAALQLRRSRYFRDIALDSAAARELRLFGIAEWVLDRFDSHWLAAMKKLWARPVRHVLLAGAAVLATLVACGLVLTSIVRAGIGGAFGVGLVAVYVQAVYNSMQLGWGGTDDRPVVLGAVPAVRLKLLEQDMHAQSSATDGATPGPGAPQLRFENIEFAYPGSGNSVFRGLNLDVDAGSSLAIVGENGAGKTTLVKLLARLYDPIAGVISVDGVPLSDLSVEAWRSRIAVIFQDFVHFELSVRSNVAPGLPREGDAERLERVAERSGLARLVHGLPLGWDTVLSRLYDGGRELSGGQWQRVALARALMAVERGATVLVLDEPTANLDVRAEAALYERFLDLTAGLTTILISHRFSTVRLASRICVLEHGQVAELGSHAELMGLGGRYARMFELQASRFAPHA